jgi:uncharacterized coiled-coil DUF342 family protein
MEEQLRKRLTELNEQISTLQEEIEESSNNFFAETNNKKKLNKLIDERDGLNNSVRLFNRKMLG